MTDLAVIDAIFSTCSRRYLKPDPIPEGILWEILDAAIRGPTAGNSQSWGWIVLRDAAIKRTIAEWYREGFDLNYGHRRDELESAEASSGLVGANFRGSEYLARHIEEAPVWIIAVLRNTAGSQSPLAGSSIYGAVQNLMLAARTHGIGSALTLNYARHETDVARLLGLPDDARTFGLIALGYPARGRFSRPRRIPVDQVTHWDSWGRLRDRGPDYGGSP